MERPYPDAVRVINQRLGFDDVIPDEWERRHLQPDRIDEFIALYWEYRDNPNEWFRDILGQLVLETTNNAVDQGKADSEFLAKVRRFFEMVAPEQQGNLKSWIEAWRSEDDEQGRLLPPLLADLIRD